MCNARTLVLAVGGTLARSLARAIRGRRDVGDWLDVHGAENNLVALCRRARWRENILERPALCSVRHTDLHARGTDGRLKSW